MKQRRGGCICTFLEERHALVLNIYSSNNIQVSSKFVVNFVDCTRLEKKFTVGIAACHSVFYLVPSDVRC